MPEPLLISIFNQLPASEVALVNCSNPIELHRRWLVVEFAHSGCQHLEMDLFGNASSAEISLSSFHPQGCFSSFHIISLKSFQRLREGASSWLDEYRRLVDETPTVVGSVLHGHTDEVG